MTIPSGTPIGKYVVRRKLAEGGMAEIYLCHALGPEGFEKEVVIKRVRSFLANDPEFVKMFIAEAQVASKLNHANIVQIFDFEKHEDTYYLAMEYVRGHSLSDVRKRCRESMVPLPPTLVAQIGSDVARGLHYAHRRLVNGVPLGIVHRDVSPHNILLSFDGAVKLTDFGIAKAGARMTSPGMLKGKFAYMSPEQARGLEVDARSDIFALGIILWELLTGGRLFDADNDAAVLRAVRRSAIPPARRINEEVTPELDAIVSRALERPVRKRFQSAFEMERALAEYVLRHAKKIEDADVAIFMRRIFPEEVSGAAYVHKMPSAVSVKIPSGSSEARVASAPEASTDGRSTLPEAARLVDPQEASTIPERVGGERGADRSKEEAAPAKSWPRDTAALRRWTTFAAVAVGLGILAVLLFRHFLHTSAPVSFTTIRLSTPETATPPPAPQKLEPVDASLASGTPPREPIETTIGSSASAGTAANSTAELADPGGEGLETMRTSAKVVFKKNNRSGSLIVHATPWATVFVDQKEVGEANPMRAFTVSAKRHRVRLQYKETSFEADVDVSSGEARVTRHFLSRE